MRFTVDHDYHIHSHLSLCSGDPEQTTARILRYARENGLREIAVTDHFWDDSVPCPWEWYAKQNFAHVSESLPLPSEDGIRFLFGCEAELWGTEMTLGITNETIKKFDFVIIPTTHLHMCVVEPNTPEHRARIWFDRLHNVLDRDLPFEKIGIAHLTCPLVSGYNPFEDHLRVFEYLTDDQYHEVFEKAAKKGVAIELNLPPLSQYEGTLETVLRPYRIAKEEGCHFYFGSDAHTPSTFDTCVKQFNELVDLLHLTEDDRFVIGK